MDPRGRVDNSIVVIPDKIIPLSILFLRFYLHRFIFSGYQFFQYIHGGPVEIIVAFIILYFL